MKVVKFGIVDMIEFVNADIVRAESLGFPGKRQELPERIRRACAHHVYLTLEGCL